MPELPEVETIARRLREHGPDGEESPSLIGRRIRKVDVLWDRTVAEPAASELSEGAAGQVIETIGRRGKFLVMGLSRGWLIFHLRMSGDLIVEAPGGPPAPHDRLVVEFTDGIRLRFNDTRKFGRVWLLDDPGLLLGALGPEPLDSSLTPVEFHSRLASRKRKIKPLLLDQTFLAGVGNIYADEALFQAGIHPLAQSKQMDVEAAGLLLDSIRSVLTEGINRNGASIDWVYRGGGYQERFQVYQRGGEPCLRCGTRIRRIEVGQRGTHFCPRCQPLHPRFEVEAP
jgi:formamidopyrimidine-DNA glycosylase